ncbi:unnamed protein product [Gordionus sp. m RMFG-2023]|uniref:uncharacterized protein LOC135930910 n=1 Tax=Gordionus sp. m RMFG-2023 TaxID=3053472 RepID=UPI0030DE7AAD
MTDLIKRIWIFIIVTIFTCYFINYYYASYLKREISTILTYPKTDHSNSNSSNIATRHSMTKEFTDYELVLPHCKILKLNSSDIQYPEPEELNMRLECVPGKTVPLTYIDSGRKQEKSENEHVYSFNMRVNLTALRLYYGGDDDFKNCKYQRILRDIKSDNPDDSITLTKSVKFKYDTTIHLNSTSFRKRNDVNQNFDIFIRVRCFHSDKSVIYQYVHTVPRESVSRYVMSQRSNNKVIEAVRKFNVLLMGIESTSNKNFERSLLKTYEYLRRKRKKVFTFKGYAKIGENTYPNLNALLTGKFTREIPSDEHTYFDNISMIWRQYEKHGYSTIYLEDEPYWSTYNFEKYGFYKSPSHFYFRPFTLELEKTMRRLSSEEYCCVYGKNEVEMLLDYSKGLIQELEESDQPYFNFNFLTRYTHSQLQGLDDVDGLLYNYFNELIESHRLKNTFIFLFGDHGLRYGSFRHNLNGFVIFIT